MRALSLILGGLLALCSLLHDEAREQLAHAASAPAPADATPLWLEPTGRGEARLEPAPQIGADDPETRMRPATLTLRAQAIARAQWQHPRPVPVALPRTPPIRAPPVTATKV